MANRWKRPDWDILTEVAFRKLTSMSLADPGDPDEWDRLYEKGMEPGAAALAYAERLEYKYEVEVNDEARAELRRLFPGVDRTS